MTNQHNNQREWEESLKDFLNTQHGTAGWEQKLENFISSLLQSERQRVYDEVIETINEHAQDIKDMGRGPGTDWQLSALAILRDVLQEQRNEE